MTTVTVTLTITIVINQRLACLRPETPCRLRHLPCYMWTITTWPPITKV